jgi:glycogen phosphorylase
MGLNTNGESGAGKATRPVPVLHAIPSSGVLPGQSALLPQNSLREAFQTRMAQQPKALTPSQETRTDAAFRALAALAREQLLARWGKTQLDDASTVSAGKMRRVHYLSMEFLLGRALGNAIAALGATDELTKLLGEYGVEVSDVLEAELDQALGNGGLGRLAACFLDSFAELGLPAFGYGLRYQFGMFAQRIEGGEQKEVPDDWMRLGNAWEVERPELRHIVGFGGQMIGEGRNRTWVPAERIYAEAFDFIVPAHHSDRVATLRQWHAKAMEPINFQAFCEGDYVKAGEHRLKVDALNWVLYPDDSTDNGRELRLKQEMLLVSASVQDVISRHLRQGGRIEQLGTHNVLHLNDTHPALVPAELMRLLMDEHSLPFDSAWRITQQATSYTNHTLMPEALETWPVALFERLLPRHLELIYQINERFLNAVAKRFPHDEGLISRVSLIDEQHGRRVRMASLAIVASHKVNGVAALHSDLMVKTIFADYAKLFPERFHNVTNGVTPRRWLQQANPRLSSLLDTRIDADWRKNAMQLQKLQSLSQDAEFGRALMSVKRLNKQRLAQYVQQEMGIKLNPNSLFDVQIKRIHEYKRQLLNLLHVIARYQMIIEQSSDSTSAGFVPRTVIIAGKAASAYVRAKTIIHLAHDIAEIVNNDPRVKDRLKLVFLPNYGVSLAEKIIPAADLSEQISTAGTEASGTGNMKFALNGALTIGTYDGANIEMAASFGAENFFEFGLRADAVDSLKRRGYQPAEFIQRSTSLSRVLDAMQSGVFSPTEPDRYQELVQDLRTRDQYLLAADFDDYLRAQARVDRLFENPAAWASCCIKNIAGMGVFSSDRTVSQYVTQVWQPEQVGAIRSSFHAG